MIKSLKDCREILESLDCYEAKSSPYIGELVGYLQADQFTNEVYTITKMESNLFRLYWHKGNESWQKCEEYNFDRMVMELFYLRKFFNNAMKEI